MNTTHDPYATRNRISTDLDPCSPTPPSPPTCESGADPEELPRELLSVVTAMGQRTWILAWAPRSDSACTVRFSEATLEEYREMFARLEQGESRWGVSRIDLYQTHIDAGYRAVVRFEKPRHADHIAASVVLSELQRVADHAASPHLLEAFSCRLGLGARPRTRPQIRLEVDDLIVGVQLLQDLGESDGRRRCRFDHVIACPAAGSLITASAS